MKVYFLDDTGKLFKDDEGNLDDSDTIPLLIRFGRNHSGTLKSKTYSGWYFFGSNLAGASLRCYLDGKLDPIELGELRGNISEIKVGNKPVHGRYIDLELTINSKGDAPVVEGYEQYFSVQEGHFG